MRHKGPLWDYATWARVSAASAMWISIAEVVTFLDLTRNVFDDASADERTRAFRKLLAHHLSKPNYSGGQAYLATQYISEHAKGSG